MTNVLIRISPSGKSLEPDASGNFEVTDLPTGSYTVQTSADKYKTDITSIQVLESQVTDLAIFLTLDRDQNKAPSRPSLVLPAEGVSVTGSSVNLSWNSSDSDKDSLYYNVLLFKEGQSSSVPIASGIRYDSLLVKNLDYKSTYYWQVVVTDSVSNPVFGEVWSFKTEDAPDLPYLFSRKSDGLFQIFSSNTTETVQLTRNNANWRPVASPNRKQIAFISNAQTEPHIFVSDLTGQNQQQVTVVPIGGVSLTELSFCWSPNGTEILYPAYDKLYAVHPDGTGLRVVAKAPAGQFFAGADWTEQGNLIVARTTGGSEYENFLYTIPAATGILKLLVGGKPGKIGNPAISVDGKQAAVSMDVSNFSNNEGRQLDAHIFQINLANGSMTDASGGKAPGTNDLDPHYSPTGARIIFTNMANDGNSPGNIYTTSALGPDRIELIKNGELSYWR